MRDIQMNARERGRYVVPFSRGAWKLVAGKIQHGWSHLALSIEERQ